MGTAIIVYLAVILLIAYIFSRKQTLADYFTNAGHTSLPMMVASNASTFVGAGVVTIIGEVHRTGISFALLHLAWAVLGGLIIAFLAPKIKEVLTQTNTFTIPDLMGSFYGEHMRLGMVFIQTFLLITWGSIQVVAIAKLINFLMGVPYEVALLGAAGVVITYCTLGGIKLDIISDCIQFWVMIIGFGIALSFILPEVGPINQAIANVPQSHWDPFAFASPVTIILGGLLTGILSLSHSGHWQRIASANSVKIVKPSYLWAIPFNAGFVIVMIIIGLSAITLIPATNDQDQVFFQIIAQYVPSWAGGIIVAAIVAMAMSTLDTILIALSTIVSRQFQNNFPKVDFDLKKTRLVTIMIGCLCFAISLYFPSMVDISMISFNVSISAVPAIMGTLYRRPKYNVGYSLWLGMILTVALYPVLEKNTFVAAIPVALIALFWPMKNKTPAAA